MFQINVGNAKGETATGRAKDVVKGLKMKSILDRFQGDEQISDLDVVVMANSTDPTLQEVFVIFTDQAHTASLFLSYTNNLITGPSGLPYFIDSLNETQTVLLSENTRETGTKFELSYSYGTPCFAQNTLIS